MIDGPYPTEWLKKELLVGRIVGVSSNPLGNLLTPAAGYIDEDECNAAFDECEYLDALIAAGYDPFVTPKGDGRYSYCEMFSSATSNRGTREGRVCSDGEKVRGVHGG
jgi:hypothetical protein